MDKAFGESVSVGAIARAGRQNQGRAIHFLDAVFQHRPVPFFQNVVPNVDSIIPVDSKNILVVCGVVNFA